MYVPEGNIPKSHLSAPRELRIMENFPERFLIVDDSSDVAHTMALMLEQYGRTARAAVTGIDALRLGARFCPEVVLLDLAMPHMDGFETCMRMRQCAWGAKARIIAFTGWSSTTEYSKAREAGFDGFLVKPLATSGLRDLLEGRIPFLEDQPYWRHQIRSGN